MRYLRGDYNTMQGLSASSDPFHESIYWGMRHKGWERSDKGVVMRPFLKIGDDVYLHYEGDSAWHADLRDVLKDLGYAD